MGKKRPDGDRGSSNLKAQITVFMILGLIILFAFIFLFLATSKNKTGDLALEESKVLNNVFQKEALKIYVESCLTSQLEEGLQLLGRQGRLWSDQPGGKIPFAEGINGITLGTDRVFYGIINQKYPQHQDAYPCFNDSGFPDYCHYPESPGFFGKMNLKYDSMISDLQSFLVNRTIWCVTNFTQTNISHLAEMVPSAVTLALDAGSNEGFTVNINYPLQFKIGKEDFSNTFVFDFFYPTQFKKLARAALINPLQEDQEKINFDLGEKTLTGSHYEFSGWYNSLGIKFESKELAGGDGIFTFTPAYGTILNNQPYSLMIARQNRPPALDYVQRLSCPEAGYDYLVMEGDLSALGTVANLTLAAQDPDEDSVSYAFDLPIGWEDIAPEEERLSLAPGSLSSGHYNFTAKAFDGFLSDEQTIRVLVDKTALPQIKVHSPYPLDVNDLSSGFSFVSKEDPAFINLTFPDYSLAGKDQEIKLAYSNSEGTENFEFSVPPAMFNTEACYSFPWTGQKSCDLNFYTADELENWDSLLISNPEFSNFRSLTNTGMLNLSVERTYCNKLNQGASITAKVVVKSCIPYQNSSHPYAYPYEKYTFGLNPDGSTNFSDYLGQSPINPFLSTHSCCQGTLDDPSKYVFWAPFHSGTECFSSPEPGCYGGIEQYTTLHPGYVLEEEYAVCDGKRGNVCGEKNYRLWKNQLVCGDSSLNKCGGKTNPYCANQKAFGLVDTNEDGKNNGWCTGTMGCSQFCEKPLVDLYNKITGSYKNPNALALEKKASSEADLNLQCGCSPETLGNVCDLNFDGIFEGHCGQNNQCLDAGVE